MKIFRQAPKNEVPWHRVAHGKVDLCKAKFVAETDDSAEAIELQPERKNINQDRYYVYLRPSEALLAFLTVPPDKLLGALHELRNRIDEQPSIEKPDDEQLQTSALALISALFQVKQPSKPTP